MINNIDVSSVSSPLPNELDTNGMPYNTYLNQVHRAVENNDVAEVKRLLAAGAEVDEKNARILIEPVTKKKYPKEINREFVSQVNDFIEKYRPALKELAKK